MNNNELLDQDPIGRETTEDIDNAFYQYFQYEKEKQFNEEYMFEIPPFEPLEIDSDFEQTEIDSQFEQHQMQFTDDIPIGDIPFEILSDEQPLTEYELLNNYEKQEYLIANGYIEMVESKQMNKDETEKYLFDQGYTIV